MRGRTRRWTAALLLAASPLLTACGSDETKDAEPSPSPSLTAATVEPQQAAGPETAADLVGDWSDDAAQWTVHFHADGTFVEDFQGNEDFRSGTYTFTDGAVTLTGLEGDSTTGTVTGDGLVFDLGTLTRR
ncbi:MAG: hypothetical protein QM621_13310 [Aeromicrobium sp.]|uniref:hypothetical protein n=1 Tax=Aeromicrobium sp. TaxID=1871063 RepID=UPI0039E60E57